MYEQTLVKILKDHIKPTIFKRLNRYKKWEYGYNQEHDVVVISRTGQIGEVYEIQGVKIALPKEDKVVAARMSGRVGKKHTTVTKIAEATNAIRSAIL